MSHFSPAGLVAPRRGKGAAGDELFVNLIQAGVQEGQQAGVEPVEEELLDQCGVARCGPP